MYMSSKTTDSLMFKNLKKRIERLYSLPRAYSILVNLKKRIERVQSGWVALVRSQNLKKRIERSGDAPSSNRSAKRISKRELKANRAHAKKVFNMASRISKRELKEFISVEAITGYLIYESQKEN